LSLAELLSVTTGDELVEAEDEDSLLETSVEESDELFAPLPLNEDDDD